MAKGNKEQKLQLIGEIVIPKGVTVTYADGTLTVVGPKGTVTRALAHPSVRIAVKGSAVAFSVTKKYTQREKKLINSMMSHAKNCFRGVTAGHVYKLKVCSGHFPMSVAVKGKEFEVKNLLGESVPRRLALKEGVKVVVNGDEVVVEGISIETVSQVAADIEELAKRPGFDKRVFMDGIWIIEKDGEPII